MPTKWQDAARRELIASKKADLENLAGRSRVAARRAAGIALVEYNRLVFFSQETDNYYELLQAFSCHPGIPGDIQQASRRLCRRVDEQYNLPVDFNLIDDAETLVKFVDRQIIETALRGE
jgi:hypothetical protein